MSRGLWIRGVKAPDDKWIEMKAIYRSCEKLGILIPDEVDMYFNGVEPSDKGVVRLIESEGFDDSDVGHIERFELSKIDKDIKYIEVVTG